MNIVIIDYNAGNIQSVRFALERLGIQPQLSNDVDTIRDADKVIFPGVGEASTTMEYLQKLGLDVLIPQLQQKVLGICLGMQLLCEHSEENDTPCLGIIPQKVRRFRPDLASPQDTNYKVPHIGWNTIEQVQTPLFKDIEANAYTYFVHSYYAEIGAHTIASSNYIHPFSAALQKDNFYATQFHPEKSGSVGEQILRNFLSL